MRKTLILGLLFLTRPVLAEGPIAFELPDVRASVLRLLEQGRHQGNVDTKKEMENGLDTAEPVAPTPPQEPVVAEPKPQPARRPPQKMVSTHVPVPEMTITITTDDLSGLDVLEEQLKEAKRRASQKPPVLE